MDCVIGLNEHRQHPRNLKCLGYIEQNTQKSERKSLKFRIKMKQLTRPTLCFSKPQLMHELVIDLYIKAVDF